jgi:hypothetical protein
MTNRRPEVRGLENTVAAARNPARMRMRVLGAYAALGLILSLIGVYGLVTHVARTRRHEIGVRMVYGAGPRDILVFLLKQTLTWAGRSRCGQRTYTPHAGLTFWPQPIRSRNRRPCRDDTDGDWDGSSTFPGAKSGWFLTTGDARTILIQESTRSSPQGSAHGRTPDRIWGLPESSLKNAGPIEFSRRALFQYSFR